MASDHGIRGVVDLREEACDDKAALARMGIAFLHLPTSDHQPPAPSDLDRGVEFVRERLGQGQRVLIHCEHGIGRSAVLMLCVLVDAGVEPLDALRQTKGAREEVSPSPKQYMGWSAWLVSRGKTAPDAHTFGCIAYRHSAKTDQMVAS
nr:dual specificity protein phosphatase family protein [Acidisphaera sp. L21]